jgi:hemolysin III
VLWVVWVGALVGIAIRMLWLRAPTWAIIPPYLVVGWVAVFVLPSIVRHAGVATLVLLLVGGVLYTLGALIFASRWPRLSPRVFGYHELFHLLTLVAGAVFYIANSLIVYRA